jgi:hypothetical protein
MRQVRWFGLVLCCGLAGCLTANPLATPLPETRNPFLEELIKQEPLVFKEGGKEIKLVPPRLKPDFILQEIPLGMPLADARAVMERHGFSCWSGVQDNYRICLYCTAFRRKMANVAGLPCAGAVVSAYCTAYRRKTANIADKVVVKLFYEQKRINDVEITVEYDMVRGFWGTF